MRHSREVVSDENHDSGSNLNFTQQDWENELEALFARPHLEADEVTIHMLSEKYGVDSTCVQREMDNLVKQGTWSKREVYHEKHKMFAYRKITTKIKIAE